MGCSKGRGLFHQQRVSFQHCCVICKATLGWRCLALQGDSSAPKALAVVLAALLPQEGYALGKEVFQAWRTQ